MRLEKLLPMSALPPPIPGRECGECQVCCIDLKIDDPELQKEEDVRCPHLIAHGCDIYGHRPRTCQSWFCGWRLLNISDAMRPDRSKILLIPEIGNQPGYEKGGLRIGFVGGDISGLQNDELLNLAGQLVARGLPLYLSYGSGAYSKRVLANEHLKPAVAAGDRTKFVKLLNGLLADMVAHVDAEMAAAKKPG